MIIKNDDLKVGNYYALESDSLISIEESNTFTAIRAGTPFLCVYIHRPFILLLSYERTEQGPLPVVESFDSRKSKFILVDKDYFSVYYGVSLEEEYPIVDRSESDENIDDGNESKPKTPEKCS